MNLNTTYKEALTISTISVLSTKSDSVDCTNNQLIAVTAAGTILGTYVSESIKESLKTNADYLVFETIGNIASENTNEPSASILLKDVTLFSNNGPKTCFKFLHLFMNDIIALSLGNLPSD